MTELRQRSGFSLVELLIVLGIICLLFGLFLPALSGARKSALKARTLSQFSQMRCGIQGFYNEYGFIPFLEKSEDIIYLINDEGNRVFFEGVLSGDDQRCNTLGIRFYQFCDADFRSVNEDNSPIVDAFGNDMIAVLIDGDDDGRIVVGDFDIRGRLEMIAYENHGIGAPEVRTW